MKGKYMVQLLFIDLYGNEYKINSIFHISEIENKQKIMDEDKEDTSPENPKKVEKIKTVNITQVLKITGIEEGKF